MLSPRKKENSGTLKSPGSRVSLQGSPSIVNGDEALWTRLREVGLDEETLKQRDKAALISYITKLESEMFDYQYHMGLLILEKKEWTSKYEQIKASADSAEDKYKRDQAALLSALAEAEQREENLQRALGVEKECVASIEKALHEMRAECAETKVAAETKLAEVRCLVEDAQKKLLAVETKQHTVEALQTETSWQHAVAERKLKEVEAREDELRRQQVSLKSEMEAKEKDLLNEKESLRELEKVIQQGQEKLFEGQTLLNQREQCIKERSDRLSRLEKEVQAATVKLQEDLEILKEEKANLCLTSVALTTREEAIVQREVSIDKKEQELLLLQEKLTSREQDEIRRLTIEHQTAIELRESQFEEELHEKHKSFEADLGLQRHALDLRDAELKHQEDLMHKDKHELDLQLSELEEKRKELETGLKSLVEKEQSLDAREKKIEMERNCLEKENQELDVIKKELDVYRNSLENERKQILEEQRKLEVMNNDRKDLLALETKLKEEVDNLRAEKVKILAEADNLATEKEKFEKEWEQIDEKREQLQKEAEWVAEERMELSKFLKTEHEILNLEKDSLREQAKRDADSLCREREAFLSEMEHGHSEWFTRIQRERADFVHDIEMQKREFQKGVDKRNEEIQRYLRERDDTFQLERLREFQYIDAQKELVRKELEGISLEMKKLENERKNIALDREQRDKEWSELKKDIEELQVQREKLKEQRELLHQDREDILKRIEDLKKLEDLKVPSETLMLPEMQSTGLNLNEVKTPANYLVGPCATKAAVEVHADECNENANIGAKSELLEQKESDSDVPTPKSWLKRCAEKLFNTSLEKIVVASNNNYETHFSRHKETGQGPLSFSLRQKSHRTDARRVKTFSLSRSTRPVPDEKNAVLEGPLVREEKDHLQEFDAETNVSAKNGSCNIKSSVFDSERAQTSANNGGECEFLYGRKRSRGYTSIEDADAQFSRKQSKRQQQAPTAEHPRMGTSAELLVHSPVVHPEGANGLKPCSHIPDVREVVDGGPSNGPAKVRGEEGEASGIVLEGLNNSSKKDALESQTSDIEGEKAYEVATQPHDNGVLAAKFDEQIGANSSSPEVTGSSGGIEELGEDEKENGYGDVDNGGGGGDDDNDDDDEVEVEEHRTLKGKLWNFLIT
ncbi:protein CROWDED NUCLEI 4 [Amborella trichopoda]|uniref:protein CROWDED NUCLEI 4 n=1 Tax=Amborella trichopoda TaxID=13333 RepID=UPI0005D405FC|nr:protein CROWDED NUCLEI 4 [Amborella trichopoda]|eukprot:XP_011627553.1 protein CROWDED NUCLEI 4 [Amborella trichopoda]